MCRTYFICFLITVVSFSLVKGSCLEYGHSCWGAHGKRSGGPIHHTEMQKAGNSDPDSEVNLANTADDMAEFYRDRPNNITPNDESRSERLTSLGLKYLLGKHGLRRSSKPNNKYNDITIPEQSLERNNDILASERWRRVLPLKSIRNLSENLLEQLSQQDGQPLRESSYYNIK